MKLFAFTQLLAAVAMAAPESNPEKEKWAKNWLHIDHVRDQLELSNFEIGFFRLKDKGQQFGISFSIKAHDGIVDCEHHAPAPARVAGELKMPQVAWRVCKLPGKWDSPLEKQNLLFKTTSRGIGYELDIWRQVYVYVPDDTNSPVPWVQEGYVLFNHTQLLVENRTSTAVYKGPTNFTLPIAKVNGHF